MKFRIYRFFEESIRGRVLIQEIGTLHYYIGLCTTHNTVLYILTKLTKFGSTKVAYIHQRKDTPISQQELNFEMVPCFRIFNIAFLNKSTIRA